MTAVTACRTCGTEPLENARFCHGCGSPVAAADTHAEYKQVTVLFADVVHSMSIAAVVGTERLREIMTELVNRAMAVVQRYGATVDQFTGDGIMAVFGAPVALEDHALRACLAALEIQREVQDMAADIDRRDGVSLRLRIGLNSGQVIAGEIRFRRNWLHRCRRAGRDGATHGVRRTARRGHAQRFDRATRRACSHSRRTGDGGDQGCRRARACPPPAWGGFRA